MKGGLIVLGDYNDTEMLNINIAYRTAIAVDLTNRVFYSRLGESSGKKLLGGVKFPVSGGGDGLAVWKITSSSSYTTAIIDYVDVVIDSSSVNFNNRELNNITTINATTYSGYSFGLTSRQNNIELVGLDNTALKLSGIRIDTSGATADYVLKVNFVDSGVVSFVTTNSVSSINTSQSIGYYNERFGYRALYSNTTGGYNSAFGCRALYFNTTGIYNSAFGLEALFSNTTGGYNSAFGYQALYSNTTGNGNSAFGFGALYSNTTGGYNSAFGYRALYSNTTGIYNSAFGLEALCFNTTGSW